MQKKRKYWGVLFGAIVGCCLFVGKPKSVCAATQEADGNWYTYNQNENKTGYHTQLQQTISCHHDAATSAAAIYCAGNILNPDEQYIRDRLRVDNTTAHPLAIDSVTFHTVPVPGIYPEGIAGLVCQVTAAGGRYSLTGPYEDITMHWAGYAYIIYHLSWCPYYQQWISIGSEHYWLGVGFNGNVGTNEIHLTSYNHVVKRYIFVPNQYEVVYHGNGATGGTMKNSKFTYDCSDRLAENVFVRDGFKFLGWSTTKDGKVVFKNQEEVRNLSNRQDGIVHLYAVWDGEVEIRAGDLYYSLQEAQEGKITEEELLLQAGAYDKELISPQNPKGRLFGGVDKKNQTVFILEDYSEGDFLNFLHEGSITETYVAKDAAGNESRKRITVYLVDTQGKTINRRLRFISAEYKDTLPSDSVWKRKKEYQDALDNACSKQQILEVWCLKRENLDKMCAFIQTNGMGNNQKKDALARFRKEYKECIR